MSIFFLSGYLLVARARATERWAGKDLGASISSEAHGPFPLFSVPGRSNIKAYMCRGFDKVVYIADTHVGEGCSSSTSGYQLNDTNCYSVRDLKRVVAKVNSLPKNQNIAFAILGGDVTSSAQTNEFIAAKRSLIN